MRESQLRVGCFAGSIQSLILNRKAALPPCVEVGIRCLDSDTDAKAIKTVLSRLNVEYRDAGDLPCLPWSVFLDGSIDNLFHGFDEIWFLDRGLESIRIPDDLILTTDVEQVSDQSVRSLAHLMNSASCRTVIADGTGLGLRCATYSDQIWDDLNQVAQRLP
jgi:hypothetical protein